MALADAKPYAVAAWNLNEASGNRADQVGTETLTDNNTVGSGTGKFGNAADFEADTSEFLSHTDDTVLSAGDIDFEIRCWVNLESKSGVRSIVWKGTLADEEYHLYFDTSSDRFIFDLAASAGFGGFDSVTASNFGSPSTGTWYLLHAWHDSVNNQIGIAVNAGTANTTAHTGGIYDGTGSFRIGQNDNSEFFDGLIDDVVLLKNYILSSAERTEDYNSGTGVAFADWAAAAPGQKSPPRRWAYELFDDEPRLEVYVAAAAVLPARTPTLASRETHPAEYLERAPADPRFEPGPRRRPTRRTVPLSSW